MTRDDLREERLARLIGASRAPADPAVLARARARIAARAAEPGVVRWLARPAVLAGAGAMFVLCVAGSFAVNQRLTAASADTSLVASVLGDGDLGLPIDTSDSALPGGAAAGDSGGVTP
jgi:hypothetical protein